MGPEVEDQLLVLVQQLAGECHDPKRSHGHPARVRTDDPTGTDQSVPNPRAPTSRYRTHGHRPVGTEPTGTDQSVPTPDTDQDPLLRGHWGLDDAQRRAVTTPDNPLCILAGAGSGKTRVLTRRIAYRCLTDDASTRATCSPSPSPARPPASWADACASSACASWPTTGTFHAVAWAQLHAHWKGLGQSPPALLDRKGRILGALLGRTQRMSVGELAAEIEWAKARLLTPDRYPLAAAQADRRTGLSAERVADLYRRYEDDKQQRRLVDFDDLLERCAEAMETDTTFAAAQRWRFRHLFVDEFQDVNPLQQRLLEAWRGDRPDLCVVGDPNQAIYRWNGADASYLLEFARRHPPGEPVVELVDNYRSTPEILGGGRRGARRRHRAAARPLRAHRPVGPVPRRWSPTRASRTKPAASPEPCATSTSPTAAGAARRSWCAPTPRPRRSSRPSTWPASPTG